VPAYGRHGECSEGHDAALTLVVSAHHDQYVFHQDDERESLKDERQDTEDATSVTGMSCEPPNISGKA